jgi:hypothetical protein
MKTLLIFIFLASNLLAWTSSEADVTSKYPQSMYKREDGSVRTTPIMWQPFHVPGGIIAKAFNRLQGVSKHEVILHDMETGESRVVISVPDKNIEDFILLSGGQLITADQVVFGRNYIYELRTYDLNMHTWSDTAIIQPVRRQE